MHTLLQNLEAIAQTKSSGGEVAIVVGDILERRLNGDRLRELTLEC
mgnify:FL=1